MPPLHPALLLLVPGPTGAVEGSGSLTLLVVYVVLAIGVSFLCSIMEAVLLSVTPAYVGALGDTNAAAADRLKELKADVDRPLAAILTLNTIAHTIGAAGAGAEAAGYFGAASVGIFSAVLTLGILVLSEIIPKTIGAVYWRGLAPLVSRLLVGIVFVLKWTGLIWLSQALTKLIARGKKEDSVSREELAALAQIGTEEGVFDASESRILQSLFRFSELKTRDVMTPRTVVVAYPEGAPLREIANDGTPFSRLPLYRGTKDTVTGFVLRDDVLRAVADGRGDEPSSTVARDLLSVPDSLPLPKLFDRLLERREHLALVVGEYGGTAGVVSVEDVVETILGLEIVDEVDRDDDMQAAARAQWAERATRLGLVDDPADGAAVDAAVEQAAAVQYGITGGEPPAVSPAEPRR
ncbi:hemolysin family protein [Rubrivirga sp. S365]|uniref:Hemolysin family protein n=1 Tax=Rubrivirga litoralis TaxID=3075598 RepID=A0ABU3BP36_9BACT|nr:MULTISPECIES: hemolysin family protein [unclassified Rubrivirga]MDT0631023.1 hemolysin family protein [Rubrivirga sp. F394]MDT7855049.1 hemolysin family protein [Rubrivirga sp. S365]